MIPDWGRRHETFRLAILEPPHALVHTMKRGRTFGSWAIVLTPYDDAGTSATHVQLRLRLSPVKRKRLAGSVGEFLDASTIAGLAARTARAAGANPVSALAGRRPDRFPWVPTPPSP